MGQILETITAFFTEDDWAYTQLEDDSILRLGFRGENGQWPCYAQAREEQDQFIFYSVCPVNTPEEKRLAMAEFISRANYGLFIGNFELDFADGEVRYKTSIDVEGDRLTIPLVKQLVYTNVIMMDRYLPGLMMVIYGDTAPTQAIAAVEGDQA